MSPLSDTTNLAPAAAGSELFAHVRHMTWSTMPSITLALIGFTIIGLGAHPKVLDLDTGLGSLSHLIQAQLAIGPHLLIPLLVVFVLAVRRFPAYPTILIAALLGAVVAVLFQPDVVVKLAYDDTLSRPMAML